MATVLERRDQERTARRRKSWGLAFLAFPALLFLALGIGEGIGGEEGWWGHLLQFAVIATLAGIAWARPRTGGPLLVLAGLVSIPLLLLAGSDLAAQLSAIAIVLLPVIVGGVFFTLAGAGIPHRASEK